MYKKLSDIEIMEQVRKGRIAAFEELYVRYSDLIYRCILVRVNSSFDADDILQTFFISLWDKREQIHVNTSVKSYLMTWLKHHILNTIRQEQIREKYNDVQILEDNGVDSTLEGVIAADLKERIAEIVSGFPSRLRVMYRLSREEHLSVKEIAERENLSEQTVKNQISDMLHRLRAEINKTNFIFF